ncbi:MAG: hypothetical protein WCP93_02565 [Candidatus Berkelbacteria bacterium]
MDNNCCCEFAPLPSGALPEPIPWFEEGTILEIEVLNFGQPIGTYQIQPKCNHEHHLGNFILGAYREAGFNPTAGHLSKLEANTIYLKVCSKHKYVKIDVNYDR